MLVITGQAGKWWKFKPYINRSDHKNFSQPYHTISDIARTYEIVPCQWSCLSSEHMSPKVGKQHHEDLY